MTPRVRFAPSPTGYLHIGGARTALFNWLYARRHGGTFVLRIEDTDAERSSWEMVGGILDGLRWLGIDWDEGPEVGGPHAPYFQSERLEKYRAAAEALIASGHAFRDEGAIRFKVPEGTTRFADVVHGEVSFENDHIESFVILRSDGHPTYHLSVVVDDIDMAITHVVRGDDHVSNTPKQVLLYEALGSPVPVFAHVPLIMGPDKKRLSKRHGATSVIEYARLGYLPQAMVNFLALLGWSPGKGDREIFTREELIAAFALEGISGGNAVFNTEKLDWLNHRYLNALSDDELIASLRPLLVEAGMWEERFGGADLSADSSADSSADLSAVARSAKEEAPSAKAEARYDYVLVSIGRRPNTEIEGLERTKVQINDAGFIQTDLQRRTDEPAIFAIGDVAGEPMLAHKASHEARVAVEAIAGHKAVFEPQAIPAVVFTDPEIAWAGLTEAEAETQGTTVEVARFSWGASGRAIAIDRTDGMTKLVIDPATERVLGVGIVGSGAGELIAEGVLAIEMGATASDLKLSIHPHPTLTETLMEGAEVFFGTATHVYKPKRPRGAS